MFDLRRDKQSTPTDIAVRIYLLNHKLRKNQKHSLVQNTLKYYLAGPSDILFIEITIEMGLCAKKPCYFEDACIHVQWGEKSNPLSSTYLLLNSDCSFKIYLYTYRLFASHCILQSDFPIIESIPMRFSWFSFPPQVNVIGNHNIL